MADKKYIFQLLPIKNSNTAKYTCKGYLNKNDKIVDPIIDLSKIPNLGMDKDTLTLKDNVTADFFNTLLTESFVLTSKKIPILYTQILHSTSLLSNLLFTITVYFEISDDMSKIPSVSVLLKNVLNGKFYIEIKIDDNIDILPIIEYTGYKNILYKLIKLIQSDEFANIIDIQKQKIAKERQEKYGNIGNFMPMIPSYNINDMKKRYQNGENIDKILDELKKN